MILRACQFEFTFPRPALTMGIVNVTPDSFSDGGQFLEAQAAIAHALALVEEGANIIDVGGESTRPGASPVAEEEELRRVIPVIEQLAGRLKVPISIDTMKPAVARAALQAGASIVNDVAANREDESMWRVVAEASAGYVCVHMQGTPQTMQANPVYREVTREVREFFFERIQRLNHCGVSRKQIILDPGIGFGKTPDHNLQLLAELSSFTRLAQALACACLAVEAGVQIIRAHDVAETVQAIRMTEAILGKRKK